MAWPDWPLYFTTDLHHWSCCHRLFPIRRQMCSANLTTCSRKLRTSKLGAYHRPWTFLQTPLHFNILHDEVRITNRSYRQTLISEFRVAIKRWFKTSFNARLKLKHEVIINITYLSITYLLTKSLGLWTGSDLAVIRLFGRIWPH